MNKESFILFIEQEEIFDTLTDKQAGQLIKAIFKYEKNRKTPELDKTVSIAFIPIKQRLDKNYEKYIEKCETNRQNGARGGRPRSQNKPNKTEQNPNKPNGYFENPKNLDNDLDTDNDYIDDKRYIDYLCLSQFEKVPELKEQVEFYKNIVHQMLKSGEQNVLDKTNIEILSNCWERLNKQDGIKDKESYFIASLKNEVEKRDNDRRT